MNTSNDAQSSEEIRAEVSVARSVQFNRQGKLNAQLSSKEIKLFANLSSEAEVLLNMAAAKLVLSSRSYIRIIKVSRTIADLDSSAIIAKNHLAEALQFR
jgi:magnesium chelatase family protein